MTDKDNRTRYRFLASLIACIVLSSLAVVFIDRPVSTWSHTTLGAPAPFVWLTHIIDPFLPAASIGIAAIGVAGIFGWRPGPLGRTMITLCLAVLLATVLKDQFKYLFGRTWPETWVDHNPSWIKDGVYRFQPFHGGRGWTSFPSGHMTLITAPCMVLWNLAPRLWRPLWAGLILAVAIGLVGADFHFVGDMIFGTFLGAACGLGAVALTRHLIREEDLGVT